MDMPNRVDAVVKEIIGAMDEREKNTVRFTKESDLIQYLHNWGRQIRNTCKLWQNPSLVAATGKDHPDDASMVIIRKVWQSLQETQPVLDAECSQIGILLSDWNIPYSPVCEACGLPYYKEDASGDWVHPFKIDGKWIGLEVNADDTTT